ncbi:transcriptional regulator [candidate division KSB1 bacterium]|nr:transcriptional regulator [candidate division KSB1 bacterium]NIR72074.1 transcriptional regulator [candidate division KSB1 bacterium]NIS26585.1 transcriptional regulator [candidate division KSB1 bacterium]NIT73347.1 transcriptional regulator [candidate division KSB1 bacterium]NIU27195.1 transcriptional regulator [candidate division KSB1 bacterium]
MNVRAIKTDADYRATLREIEQLFDAAPGTPEGDRLQVLTTLVEAYEDEKFDIPLPDPIEAIKYHMKSRGLSERDLEKHLGSSEAVRQVLARKRELSIEMIRRLHAGLGISAEVLIQPYSTKSPA